MTLPLIGVTASFLPKKNGDMGTHGVSEAYIQAVLNAGGMPVLLPVSLSLSDLPELFSRLDGVLFTGGADIDPARFGGAAHPRVYGIDERRDELEIRLVKMAAKTGKPFLGICRGIQVINVALGGSLFTDIWDQMPGALKHDQYPDFPRDFLVHAISIAPASHLASILGAEACQVNSLHHQGIDRVAPDLTPVAVTADNLVEAVELSGHPFGLGVQWHPEWLQVHESQRQLFRAFIQAAEKQRENLRPASKHGNDI